MNTPQPNRSAACVNAERFLSYTDPQSIRDELTTSTVIRPDRAGKESVRETLRNGVSLTEAWYLCVKLRARSEMLREWDSQSA